MEQPDPYAPPESDVQVVNDADLAREVAGRSPWVTVWLQPRATIQAIVATNPARANHVLAMGMGVSQSFDRAALQSVGDTLELPVILAMILLAGPIGGILTLYVGAALLAWTGRWLGGHAPQAHVRAAVAWSNVPVVCSLLLILMELLLLGGELFTTATPRLDASGSLQLAMAGFAVVEFVIGLWAMVLFLKCLGQVQGFSAWTALGNAIIAGLAIAVPIAVVAIAAVVLAGSAT